MKKLHDQYSRNLPSIISTGKQAKSSAAWNFPLTGTTGSLGTYLLAVLENMPRAKVGKIFCLNRSLNAKERQRKCSKARGLKFVWDDRRMEFFHADLPQLDLGLGAEKYAELLDKTTIVIQNAWPVNFNLALDSFEP
jgi:thioester reductase-like protein